MIFGTREIRFILAAFVLLFGLGACSKLNTPPGSSPTGDAVSAADVQAVYPHSAEFKSSLHGKKFLAKRAVCQTCHGKDLSGGATHVSCTKCHQEYPHSDDFKAHAHGALFWKDRDSCTKCHGANLDGGDAGVSCTKCHNYPHTDPEWANPEKHGAQYLADFHSTVHPAPGHPTIHCGFCHTAGSGPMKINPDIPMCDMCHALVPHGDDFVMGGHKDAAKADITSCTVCHEGYKKLMPDFPKGCVDCHDASMPLPSSSPSPQPSGRTPGASHRGLIKKKSPPPAIKPTATPRR